MNRAVNPKSASRQSVCSLLYSCFVRAEYIKRQCARLKPREEWYYGCELYMCLNLRCFKSVVMSRAICAQDPGSMGIPIYIHLNQFAFNWVCEVSRLALPISTSMYRMTCGVEQSIKIQTSQGDLKCFLIPEHSVREQLSDLTFSSQLVSYNIKNENIIIDKIAIVLLIFLDFIKKFII